MRLEIGVTDDEHRQLLRDLGIDGVEMNFDPEAAATFENWLRVDNYRRVIEPTVIARLEQGRRLVSALEDIEVSETIKKYREIYQISEAEHVNVMTSITGSGGLIVERAKRQLDLLAEDSALIFGLRCKRQADPQWNPIGEILVASTARRSTALIAQLFSTLLTLGETRESRALAACIGDLMGSDIERQLVMPAASAAHRSWADSLDGHLVGLLRGGLLDEVSNSEMNEGNNG